MPRACGCCISQDCICYAAVTWISVQYSCSCCLSVVCLLGDFAPYLIQTCYSIYLLFSFSFFYLVCFYLFFMTDQTSYFLENLPWIWLNMVLIVLWTYTIRLACSWWFTWLGPKMDLVLLGEKDSMPSLFLHPQCCTWSLIANKC